ncbi:MAG: pilin [Alphaproteobacteria bacterium]|nr:pilin [Alphaproteobacteria bacterium]
MFNILKNIKTHYKQAFFLCVVFFLFSGFIFFNAKAAIDFSNIEVTQAAAGSSSFKAKGVCEQVVSVVHVAGKIPIKTFEDPKYTVSLPFTTASCANGSWVYNFSHSEETTYTLYAKSTTSTGEKLSAVIYFKYQPSAETLQKLSLDVSVQSITKDGEPFLSMSGNCISGASIEFRLDKAGSTSYPAIEKIWATATCSNNGTYSISKSLTDKTMRVIWAQASGRSVSSDIVYSLPRPVLQYTGIIENGLNIQTNNYQISGTTLPDTTARIFSDQLVQFKMVSGLIESSAYNNIFNATKKDFFNVGKDIDNTEGCTRLRFAGGAVNASGAFEKQTKTTNVPPSSAFSALEVYIEDSGFNYFTPTPITCYIFGVTPFGVYSDPVHVLKTYEDDGSTDIVNAVAPVEKDNCYYTKVENGVEQKVISPECEKKIEEKCKEKKGEEYEKCKKNETDPDPEYTYNEAQKNKNNLCFSKGHTLEPFQSGFTILQCGDSDLFAKEKSLSGIVIAVKNIFKVLVYVGYLLAGGLIVWLGMRYVFAAFNEKIDAAKEATNTAQTIVVGIVLVIGAGLLVKLVYGFFFDTNKFNIDTELQVGENVDYTFKCRENIVISTSSEDTNPNKRCTQWEIVKNKKFILEDIGVQQKKKFEKNDLEAADYRVKNVGECSKLFSPNDVDKGDEVVGTLVNKARIIAPDYVDDANYNNLNSFDAPKDPAGGDTRKLFTEKNLSTNPNLIREYDAFFVAPRTAIKEYVLCYQSGKIQEALSSGHGLKNLPIICNTNANPIVEYKGQPAKPGWSNTEQRYSSAQELIKSACTTVIDQKSNK